MNLIQRTLLAMKPLDVAPGTAGIYAGVLPTFEVKIGASTDIAKRFRSKELSGAKLVAVMPGMRSGVEADIHARLRPYRSRVEGQPMFRETYHATAEVIRIVKQAQSLGFTAAHLHLAKNEVVRRALTFDDGQTLSFDFTYLQVTEPGLYLPHYVLARRCKKCRKERNSLEFLNAWNVEELGRPLREYMVLESTDLCMHCKPTVFPATHAFVNGETRIRVGKLIALSGQEVKCYDRDSKRWVPLKLFGVRRMAKKPRPGAKNDFHTLRMQPSITRRGKAQGKT